MQNYLRPLAFDVIFISTASIGISCESNSTAQLPADFARLANRCKLRDQNNRQCGARAFVDDNDRSEKSGARGAPVLPFVASGT
jgi:hypothetical protein